MVRLTPEHWDATRMRADGRTYTTVALEQDCSHDVAKVVRLRLTHEAGGGVGAEVDGS